MADPNNQYPNALQFFSSPMFVGLAVSFVSGICALFGITVSASVITAKVQGVAGLVTLAGIGYAMFARWRSKVQPLTLTDSAAAVLNAVPPAPPAPKDAPPFVPTAPPVSKE
jgi:hypothetical protein